MYASFFSSLDQNILDILSATIKPALSEAHSEKLRMLLSLQVKASFGDTSTLDTDERFHAACRPLVADVFAFLQSEQQENEGRRLIDSHTFDALSFHRGLASSLAQTWVLNRASYFRTGTAEHLLGLGTGLLYNWVRKDLDVPMQKGVDIDEEDTDVRVSRIYEGIVRGDVNAVLVRMFDQGVAGPFDTGDVRI